MPTCKQKGVRAHRCPVCFSREIDVVLAHNGKEYYCIKCSFAGDEAEVFDSYKAIRSKYKWILKRVPAD